MKKIELNEKDLRKYHELKAIIHAPRHLVYGYLSEIIPEFKELLEICDKNINIKDKIESQIKNLEYYKPTNFEHTIMILKDIIK